MTEVGMWHGSQRRAAEADGWQVWETSMWAAFCARKGGEYPVWLRGSTMKTVNDGGW